jgi:hypothetical protein
LNIKNTIFVVVKTNTTKAILTVSAKITKLTVTTKKAILAPGAVIAFLTIKTLITKLGLKSKIRIKTINNLIRKIAIGTVFSNASVKTVIAILNHMNGVNIGRILIAETISRQNGK